eukprot:CAMPEP_0197652584 /NCGR_PEP_ID=MMETSP1338-20131121/34540_1 /TAXON_ID=43686 ORGANISM="Pelagodinium beii, Strain RCC1491" /NCGR_SAMPLE_ID=MMETSP1338 /ASSEMBLY_ACC=CAM_ASM_000754 /LENGTH=401 /DNA_ID=CAMNT_0043227495 /DNA_START=66 /DNA_END=1268 /DNA_ORIENTATION=-
MEFNFNVASYIGAPPDHDGPFVGLVDEELLKDRSRSQDLCEVMEAVGKKSAVAQGLRKPVTLGHPYLLGQRIYLMADGRAALGFIKVGTKRLYVAPPHPSSQVKGGLGRSDVKDALREINPMCALDFYVHESCQRHGYGKTIFETMLRAEGLLPAQLAYDRPSPKLIGFLAKHYGLTEYMPQNNNYVVFDDYYQMPGNASESNGRSGRSRSGPPPLRESASTPAAPWLPQSSHPGLYQPQMQQAVQQDLQLRMQQQIQQQMQQQMQQMQVQQQFPQTQQHSPLHQQHQRQPPFSRSQPMQPTGKVTAPWGTSADGYGASGTKFPPRLPTGSNPLSSDTTAAGKPSRAPSRGGRSASLPSSSRHSGPFGGEYWETRGSPAYTMDERGASAAGSSSRFASPLS